LLQIYIPAFAPITVNFNQTREFLLPSCFRLRDYPNLALLFRSIHLSGLQSPATKAVGNCFSLSTPLDAAVLR
jgi:hypothetical protein